VPDDLGAEGVQRLLVARHAVIVGVPAQDAGKPASLLGDGLVATSQQLALKGVQLHPRPFRVGDAFEHEPPLPGLPADVREAEELEPAPRGAMRKEMTDINISSVPAGMPALG